MFDPWCRWCCACRVCAEHGYYDYHVEVMRGAFDLTSHPATACDFFAGAFQGAATPARDAQPMLPISTGWISHQTQHPAISSGV